jgi:phosphoribosylaminoimidazole-succinocarboxamide synthase
MYAGVEVPGMPRVVAGKVRDVYDAGDGRLLLVASDRISAFDVVMDQAIADKGRVLTAFSAFWFDELADVVPSHLVSTSLDDLPEAARLPELEGRIMLCRRAEMLPVECIVRGYLAGSALKEYRASGTMHGTPLPAGLLEASALPEPVFTPSTKADVGDHDINIDRTRAREILGAALADEVESVSLELFRRGAARAAERGIVIADTKFEFGLIDGTLVLADEVLTPDSSRFWPAGEVHPGVTPPSFDKQPLRDFLEGLDWPKAPPPPALPDAVVDATAARYRDAYERVTGRLLAGWPGG